MYVCMYVSNCSNLICFKVQMTLGVRLEPEGDLNYFDKFMRLTQNRIFEITSMS